ncbi:hypothetical protein SAMN04489841_2106 [Natrinema salaciae]|uniref:Uncharacterized protein n=2 Tax=Natrinema salaciae TaxID=1186196 RepID=A0A1H9I4L5_9EURY|nr:hypothetical protein SAMN04489841_2106 [Natrinema salaciae]
MTLAAVLVVATVAMPLAAASVVSSGSGQDGSDAETGPESIAPGERFVAAVGVQNAEIEGDVAERAFDVRLSNADSNETKAAVIATQHEESEARLADLEERLEAVNESREADEISDGRYRAEVAKTVAEMRSVERRAAAAETAAVGIPADVLADRGVDLESIRTLRERAGELGGPDTAAVARSIAGDDVGRSMSDDRAPGGSDGSANASRSTERTADGNESREATNEN